jgi:hypothetical protein
MKSIRAVDNLARAAAFCRQVPVNAVTADVEFWGGTWPVWRQIGTWPKIVLNSFQIGIPTRLSMKQQVTQLLVVIVSLVFFVLLFVGAYGVIGNLKLRRIRRERAGKGFTRERFIDSFRSFRVPDKIPATVFDYYTSSGIWKNFPLSPDDTYSQVLWDDPDDIDEDARALIERLQMRVLPEYILREYGNKPLVTVRDMVLWLDWIHQRQSTKY